MAIYSVGDHASIDAKFSRPIRDTLRFPIGGDQAGTPLISCLISSGGPTTVIRGIVSIAVDALKRQTRRTFTHVSTELLGTINPRIAHADTASAVVRKLLVRWVKASCLHVNPSVVLLGSSKAMNKIGSRCSLFLQATTGMNSPRSNVPRAYYLLISAITNAIPVVVWTTLTGKASNNQASYPKTRAINKSRHFVTSIMVNNHCETRSNRVIEVPLLAAKPSYARGF